MSTHLSFDERFVVEHEPFLRRLARGLIGRDPAPAEDAVQDTWLGFLEAPPIASPRAYLAAMLRNKLLRRGARESARPGVERRGAREERIGGDMSPSALSDGDIVRRLELSEELARALRGLPEAQRRALFLRYNEDLSPAEIAARTGEPVGTVKTRLARGLVALRAELDARHGGARSAWGVAALEWAQRAPGRGVGGVGFGVRVGLIAGAIGMAALVVSLALRPNVSPPRSALTTSAGRHTPESATESTVESAAAAPVVRHEVNGPAPEADGTELTPLQPGVGQLTVRLADLAGEPLVGAFVSATWRSSGVVTLADWGPRPEPQPVTSSTSATGVATLALSAHPEVAWTVRAEVPGHVQWVLESVRPTPGAPLELGTVTLGPSAQLAVEIVDATGAPLIIQDTLGVSVAAPGSTQPVALAGPRGRIVPITGAVVTVDHLPAGRATPILFRNQGTAESVELVAGETRSVTLHVTGPDVDQDLQVHLQRVQGTLPSLVDLTLTDPAGVTRAPDSFDGRAATWAALEPGEHTLRAVAPGFEPLQRPVVEGLEVSLELVPDSSVRLCFVDAAGEPVSGRAHVARYRAGSSWPTALGDVFDGVPEVALLPGDHRLRVRGERFDELDLDVLALGQGERRELVVTVNAAPVITGWVRDTTGQAVPGAFVQLARQAEVSDGPGTHVHPGAGPVRADWRSEVTSGYTDREGRFRLSGVAGVSLVLRTARVRPRDGHDPLDAAQLARRQASTTQLDGSERVLGAHAGSEVVEVEMVLVGDGFPVSGRFVGATHAPFDGLSVVAVHRSGAQSTPFQGSLAASLNEARVEPDGRFCFAALAPGEYTFVLGSTYERDELPQSWRSSFEIAEIEIPVGGLEGLLLDVEATLAPPIEVRVRSNVALSPSVIVAAARAGSVSCDFIAELESCVDPAVPFAMRGRLRVDAGPRWTIYVNDPTDGWVLSREIDLDSATLPVVFDVELATAEVRLVDGHGAPLVGWSVTPAPGEAGLDTSPIQMHLEKPRSDGEGRVTLRLPIGESRLQVLGQGEGPSDAPRLGPIPWPALPGMTLVVPRD